MGITNRIRQVMEERNMTGQDLAQKIGSSRSYISTVLSGRVGVSDEKITEILMYGFDFGMAAARKKLALWRIEDILHTNPDVVGDVAEILTNNGIIKGQTVVSGAVSGVVQVGGANNRANEGAVDLAGRLGQLSGREREGLIALLQNLT